MSGAGNVSDRRGIPPSDTRQVLDEHESSATVPTTAREEISATCVGVHNGSEGGLSGSNGMMPAINVNAAFSGLSLPRLNKFVGYKPDDDDGAIREFERHARWEGETLRLQFEVVPCGCTRRWRLKTVKITSRLTARR